MIVSLLYPRPAMRLACAVMTFYEAALDILNKEGKPLHYEDITRRALEEGLLSHVGRVPGDIMLARLLAMAKRDDGRNIAVVEPGVFGLAEWGIEQHEEALKATEPDRPQAEESLRSNERTPLTLAERRAVKEAERAGRFESEDKEARARAKRRRRRPKRGETTADALASIINEIGGGPIDLIYVVEALPRQPSLPSDMPSDIEGLRGLAKADNDLRKAEKMHPRFQLEDDRITLLPDVPAEEKEAEPEEVAKTDGTLVVPRPDAYSSVGSSLLVALRGLTPEKLEAALLELAARHSLTDAKVAKRSAKGSPLFTGMVRPGSSQIRVAVRMLLSGRDIRADDVDEVRTDLENYGATAGLVLSLGKVTRGARSRAEDMSQKPVLLFDGERLAVAFARAGLGVRVRLEETVEVFPGALESITSNEST